MLVLFHRDHWGTVPTMVRLVRRIQEKNDDEKITVMTLLENGPVIQECKRIIAAKCFSVILSEYLLSSHIFVLTP